LPYPPLRSFQSGSTATSPTMLLHPTAITPLTSCRTPGVHFIDPRCYHTHSRDAIEGKFAVCPFGDPASPHVYELDREALRRVLPHCRACSGRDGSALRKPEVRRSDINPPKVVPEGERVAIAEKPTGDPRVFTQNQSSKAHSPQDVGLSAKQVRDRNGVRRALAALRVPSDEIERAILAFSEKSHSS